MELQRELIALDKIDVVAPDRWRKLAFAAVVVIGVATTLVGGWVVYAAPRTTEQHDVVTPSTVQVVPPSTYAELADFMPSSAEMSEMARAQGPIKLQRPAALKLKPPPSGISIDFMGESSPLAPADVAGIIPLANWNNVTWAKTDALTLVDSAGNPLLETHVVVAADDVHIATPISKSADARMMAAYLERRDGANRSGAVRVTITNLPPALAASGYAVIVYSDATQNPQDQITSYQIWVGPSGEIRFGRDVALTDYPLLESTSGFVVARATEDKQVATPIANCAVFAAHSEMSFTVRVAPGPINAIQIVPSNILRTGL